MKFSRRQDRSGRSLHRLKERCQRLLCAALHRTSSHLTLSRLTDIIFFLRSFDLLASGALTANSHPSRPSLADLNPHSHPRRAPCALLCLPCRPRSVEPLAHRPPPPAAALQLDPPLLHLREGHPRRQHCCRSQLGRAGSSQVAKGTVAVGRRRRRAGL